MTLAKNTGFSDYTKRALLVARIIENAQVKIRRESIEWKSIPWHADWNEELIAVLRGKKDVAHPKCAGTVFPHTDGYARPKEYKKQMRSLCLRRHERKTAP